MIFEQLCEELERCLPLGVTVRVIAAPQRDRAAVVGASLLARDASFPDVCATRKIYEREGATGVLAFCDHACGMVSEDEKDRNEKSARLLLPGVSNMEGDHLRRYSTKQTSSVLASIVKSLSSSTDHEAMRIHGVHLRMINALRRSLDLIVEQAETEKEGDSNSAMLLAKWKAADELRCKSMATTCKGTLNRAKKRILELEEEIKMLNDTYGIYDETVKKQDE